jgi:hypothetical protein
MPEYRLAADLDHRLGSDVCLFGEPGAEATRQYHSFHGIEPKSRLKAAERARRAAMHLDCEAPRGFLF